MALRYESRKHPPLRGRAFARRLANHFAVAAAFMAVSLWGGMIGYHRLEGLPWLDAFLNTAMLLGGMGPVNPPVHPGGKLFAGLFALYAGLLFLFVAGLMLAPVAHRLMHEFHWEDHS